MHYYQFHIGDYRASTAHLSNEEDLAYRRLIDMYYDLEGPIPLDMDWVAKRIRVEPSVIRDVLNDMFQRTDDGYTHARCDQEIERYRAKQDQASRAGKASAERRQSARSASVQRPFNARSTDEQPTNNQEPITKNQELNSVVPNGTTRPADAEPEVVKGKLPECSHKAVLSLYHEILPVLNAVEIWNDVRQGLLRSRWREVAEKLRKDGEDFSEAAVLEWWRSFFGYIGKSKFLTGRAEGAKGKPFKADLEWIIRPTNFAKIIEGKYHGG